MEITEDKYTYRYLDLCHSHVSELELDFYLYLCDNITFPPIFGLDYGIQKFL